MPSLPLDSKSVQENTELVTKYAVEQDPTLLLVAPDGALLKRLHSEGTADAIAQDIVAACASRPR
jgi:hypothetical protein